MPGVPPKPASKRRRANKPTNWGAATPTTVPAAAAGDRELGFAAHPLVVGLWTAVQESCEAKFFSEADWARLRLECLHADMVMADPSAASWAAVQHGLNELLISPAAKRRAAIEVKASGPDAFEDAAVLTMLDGYRESLKPR